MRRRLDVFADLEIQCDGRDCRLRASGQQVDVEVPDLAAGLSFGTPGSPRGLFTIHRAIKRASTLGKSLSAMGLQIRLISAGRSIAKLGRGAESPLMSFLGYSNVRINYLAALRQYFR